MPLLQFCLQLQQMNIGLRLQVHSSAENIDVCGFILTQQIFRISAQQLHLFLMALVPRDHLIRQCFKRLNGPWTLRNLPPDFFRQLLIHLPLINMSIDGKSIDRSPSAHGMPYILIGRQYGLNLRNGGQIADRPVSEEQFSRDGFRALPVHEQVDAGFPGHQLCGRHPVVLHKSQSDLRVRILFVEHPDGRLQISPLKHIAVDDGQFMQRLLSAQIPDLKAGHPVVRIGYRVKRIPIPIQPSLCQGNRFPGVHFFPRRGIDHQHLGRRLIRQGENIIDPVFLISGLQTGNAQHGHRIMLQLPVVGGENRQSSRVRAVSVNRIPVRRKIRHSPVGPVLPFDGLVL